MPSARRRSLLLIGSVMLAACDGGGAPSGVAIPPGCNGAEALCDRRFDEVAYAGAHNAMSNADERWGAPNQNHGIARGLEDGIRVLLLDTHYENRKDGPAFLCHNTCAIGSRPLVDGLADIRAFLAGHRGEVVAIIFEAHVSAAATATAFEAAGLLPSLHAQPKGDPWPTLREMIAGDRRLVVFTDAEGGAFPWYHDQWAYTWENPYAAKTAADFSCALDRGSKDNPLFTMNHFLTDPIASAALAEQVNHDPLFIDRAMRCRSESGRLPNFVAVDFYDIGDLFSVVRALNGI